LPLSHNLSDSILVRRRPSILLLILPFLYLTLWVLIIYSKYILGNALRYEQKNAEAIEAYKQVLIFYPKFTQLRFNLGGAYVVAKNKQGALEQYQELLKLDKKRAEQLMKSIRAMR